MGGGRYDQSITHVFEGQKGGRHEKLPDWINGCIRRRGWKDAALPEFCMLALGMLAGLAMPHRAAVWRSKFAPGCFFRPGPL